MRLETSETETFKSRDRDVDRDVFLIKGIYNLIIANVEIGNN